MRLDHLLSKEHLAGSAGAEPLRSHTSTGGQLMGGTLTLALGGSRPAQYRCSQRGTVGLVSPGACTLLGPEGPDGAFRRLRTPLDRMADAQCAEADGTDRMLRTTQWTRAS